MRLTLLFSLLFSCFCLGADFDSLLEQAESGDPKAQFELAELYSEGNDDVTRSRQEAAFWYQQAAQNKHINAQITLANLYLSGNGVDKSQELALFWLTNAATSNSPRAQYLLGQLYENLEQPTNSQKLAELWYEKASSQVEEAELAYSRLLEQQFNNRRAKQVAAIDQLEDVLDSPPIELSAQAKSIQASKNQHLKVTYGLIAVIGLLTIALVWMIKRSHATKFSTNAEQKSSKRQEVKLERELKRKEETIKQQKRQLETMFKHIKKLQLASKTTSTSNKTHASTSNAPTRKESPLALACALFGFQPDNIPDEKQIKARYKQLSKIYHPDLKGSDDEMKRLNHSLKLILKQAKGR